tara:strand:- start:13077 stop:15977 length:2901 start_codon:yes stop_codon:yes gene_type:complete
MKKIYVLFLFLPFLIFGQIPDPLLAIDDQYNQDKWVDSLYNSFSLKEKVGQLFMPMVFTERDSSHYRLNLNLIKEYKIGGLVFSLGGPVIQSQWLNSFQKVSKTPLLISMDAEWGVAMRLDSVKPFPWPMTLGAVKDTSLLRKIGKRMGEQEKRLGIHYSFSPVLDINTNPKNPIIGNRSYGSSSSRVTRQALAIMEGHHQAGVLTSGKHFPGHGDTSQDSHKTLPTVEFSADRINKIELSPYRKLIKKGLSSVMVAHLNIPSISEEGLPTSLSKEVIQGILKKDLGFKGLIVTDALNMKGVTQYSKNKNIDLIAFLAGHDILIISNNIPEGVQAITKAYKKGIISEKRLSHSVKKILKAKYKVGLNRYRDINLINLNRDLNTIEDQMLHYEAIGEALTLLKNKNNILPLKTNRLIGHIALGDDSSDFFEEQLEKYQSIKTINDVTPLNVEEKTKNIDTLVISFHRSNKTPWKASDFSKQELNVISKLAKNKILIIDVFVKPYALSALDSIDGIDGLLLSYQNSKASQILSADAIFGAQKIRGRLPVNISELYQEGDGIDQDKLYRMGYASGSALGFDTSKLEALDRLAQLAIDSLMTPGMRVLVSRKGKIFYDKSFGFHTYKKERRVNKHDLYDLASLTKILGTLPLVMKAVGEKKINLETTIGDLIPEWIGTDKDKISLKKMLSHQARLFPWIPFYKETLNSKGYPKNSIYKSRSSKFFSLPVTSELFLKSDFEKDMYNQIKESVLLEKGSSKYSDLPYYILKKYFENKSSLSYDKLVQESIFNPLGLERISYKPLKRFSKKEIIPSEIDTYFRHTKLHGYVHDMGAAMQDGVGGHAGLFGDAYSVASIMQMYLQGGSFNGVDLIKSEVIDSFNQYYYNDLGSRRGVGFDKPQLNGKHESTCGCVSKKSFGHSGYTGTYAWADPEKEIIIIILANRTYPNDDFTFSKNNIRTRLQEYVYEALIN